MFWFKPKFIPGVHPDTRSIEAKKKDYKQSEFVTAPTPPIWINKQSYRSFPVRKQNGSGSCWAQATEKERGILGWLKYGEFPVTSASCTYQKRLNPAVSGTTIEDRFNYANNGSVLNSIMPDQSMTDEQMNNVIRPKYVDDMAKTFAAKVISTDINIDTIASTIEATQKGIGVCFRFGPGEWFNNKEVKMLPTSNQEWGHAVVAVDYTLNNKGEKCLVIEDSACEDGYPQRLVPESFLLNRCFYAGYLMSFKTYEEVGEVPEKPHFDESIVSLQTCLKYTGDFPVNVPCVESFGAITKAALIKWQTRVGLPNSGFYGKLTKARLHLDFP
jgi:hypothetical protein